MYRVTTQIIFEKVGGKKGVTSQSSEHDTYAEARAMQKVAVGSLESMYGKLADDRERAESGNATK